MSPLLECRGLTVRFAGLMAVDEVDLAVDEGQIVAVIGPNGAGKTTLFHCFTGFVRPTRGVVRFRGRAVNRLGPAERAALGVGRTFQQGGLWPSETAMGNLLIAQHLDLGAGSLAGMLGWGKERARELDRRAMAERVLAILGLEAYAGEVVQSMPYGSRKLLELGCALVSRPAVLLLDEPGAGMGGEEMAWLAEVIRAVRDQLGVTIVVIEHHVPLVKTVADHVVVLNLGRVIAAGAPDAVTRQPAVLEAYLGTRAPGAHGPAVDGDPIGSAQ